MPLSPIPEPGGERLPPERPLGIFKSRSRRYVVEVDEGSSGDRGDGG